MLQIHPGTSCKRSNPSLRTCPTAGGEEEPLPEDLGTSWATPGISIPASAAQGGGGAVWQSRFGSIDVIISTAPTERLFVNGLSGFLFIPLPLHRALSGYLQPCREGVCSCQESWMLQVSFECAITAGDSPFPPFLGI